MRSAVTLKAAKRRPVGGVGEPLGSAEAEGDSDGDCDTTGTGDGGGAADGAASTDAAGVGTPCAADAAW